ncbi:kazal-type serine protease inhibitor domain-containing protein 1-like [Symphorus nematophorus]
MRVLVLPVLPVLLVLCLTPHTCRALPNQLPPLHRSSSSSSDPLLDYDRLDEELGGGGGGGRSLNWTEHCGPCEPELCPETRGCRAGLVLDACGCCKECGNLEGQACDPGDRSVYYGLCGTGLRCQADPRPSGGRGGGGGGDEEEEEEEEEPVCVCEQQEAVCGSDGVTYLNMCQFKETAFSAPGLKTRGKGPCKTVPIIKVPPHSQVNGTGSSLVFLCEVFAFPMALVEWRKEGRDIVLPGDDPHISVQSRGGPLKFELSSWLQIEGAEPADSGTYRCIARNNLGSVSASAVLGVLGAEELSSYLANSVSEMKQLMDATDYDQDFY